jgi:hypothetical protein
MAGFDAGRDLPPGWSRDIIPGGGMVWGDLTGYMQFHGVPPAAVPPPAAAPVVAPQAVTEAAAAATGGAISNTKMPVSWGDRRVYGKVIDHIIHAIDAATGFGAETLCISAGEPLFKDVPNDLYKITAGSTVIYDASEGVMHPALSEVRWYDGTSDDQEQDPAFVAVHGADVVPAYLGQMIAVLEFNTYEPWQGSRPEPFTLFITDFGTARAFKAWAKVGSGGTLNPGDVAFDVSKGASATDLEFTNGNNTVKRVAPITPPPADPLPMPTGQRSWIATRGTVGRASDQPDGQGWFVFEAKNDIIADYAMSGVVLFPGENQGPGLATEDWAATDGANSAKSLYWTEIGDLQYNNTNTGMDSLVMPEGSWTMFAVRLDIMRIWKGINGNSWDAGAPPSFEAVGGDPIEGTGGIDISYLSGHTIYPAWFTMFTGTQGTVNLTGPFLNRQPGYATAPEDTGMRNWGEVFVELAKHANLDPNHIILEDVTEASEGGIIYDGFAWTDVVTNAGKMSNIDWWEDGEDIFIKQTAFDNPPNDVASIPTNHRYIIDEDRGATDAERGGERRKPVVYSIGYYDVSRQFQESFMMARSEVHLSVHEEKLSTPFVMTATEAATRSAIALGKSEMEFEEHHIELPPMMPYMRLRPADIVSFLEETKTMQTKVSQWTLETDWTVKTSYRKLFTTATNPVVPFTGEIIDANMPAYVGAGTLLFTEPNNSGFWALFEDI